MTMRAKGLLVLVMQIVLVLSVAGKYAWERHTCPRVWTPAAQFDPQQPIRGRYLALNLRANACDLPQTPLQEDYGLNTAHQWGPISVHRWQVVPVVKSGRLYAELADPQSPVDASTLTLRVGTPCESALLYDTTEFFIAEHAQTPFPLAKGEELWAEVTVPPTGPPRPLRLAVSNGKDFHVLNLR